VHFLALEVRSKWPCPVWTILQSLVSIGREGARKNGNVPEYTLQWLVQHVRNLVLEVLTCRQWGCEEKRTTFASINAEFTACSTDIRVYVEAFPELVDGRACGLRAYIKQDTYIGLDKRSKCVEEPSVTVEFFLVLLFQAEDDLDGTGTCRNFSILRHNYLGSIFEDVGGHIFAPNGVLGDTLLITAHQIENFEGALIDFRPSIGNDANDNLLPSLGTPCL
jgi:hypothetical protein